MLVCFRSALILLSVVFCGLAAASFPPSSQYSVNYSGTNYGSTPDAACAAASVVYDGANGPATVSYQVTGQYQNNCRVTSSSGDVWDWPINSSGSGCPANSTLQGESCVCSSGFTESGGQCVDANAACAPKMGKSTIVNFTVGYARTPDANDYDLVGAPNKLPASGNLCYQGCAVAASYGGPGVSAWRSQTPTAQGLYRLSLDLPALQLGTACTADGGSSAPLRPDLPSPPCPGFVGEVNGKPGCYGTANNPVNVVPADRPPVAPVAGNPAAGEKPASGEGSGTGSRGRTPTTGNGGNAGGPASAAVGGAGGGAGGTAASGASTKPTEEGKEQVACGAPGQPKCSIDESGTPRDYTGNAGLTEWKAAVDSNRAQIKDSGGGVFDGFAIFFSAPPVASCSPFDLPNDYGSLDPCPVVDGVRGVMGYIWALGALFLCIGWIREAI